MLIAPLVELDALPHGQGELVRRGEMSRYWAIWPDGTDIPTTGVDLLLIQPVLLEDLRMGHRIASMDDRGQTVLGAWIAEILTYRQLKDGAS